MAIASHLSEKLANSEIGARSLCEVFEEAFSDNKAVSEAMRADIVAHFDRDRPAAAISIRCFTLKGFSLCRPIAPPIG